MLLFQYGSNMSAEGLQAKVRKHADSYAPVGCSLDMHPCGAGRLPGWRFTFDLYSRDQKGLVADIVPGADTDEVWGVLYELDRQLVERSDGERSVFDRIEGYRTQSGLDNYRPVAVLVELDGSRREAVTYAGTDDGRRRCADEHADARLLEAYAGQVLAGARSLGLTTSYLRTVERAIAAAGGVY
jgi:hypothetical protein